MGGSSGSSPVVGILLIVAIVVGVVLWQRAADAARKKVTRGIMRGTHARGQAAVRTALAFTAPAPCTPDQAIEQIVATVNAYPSPPALVGGLYLKSRTDDAVVFGFGSRIGDAFVLRVVLSSDDDGGGGGVRGRAVVPAWTERDGLVDAIEQIERAQGRVEEAVGRLGGVVERVAAGS